MTQLRFVHGLLALSFVGNLVMAGALISTYLNNIYFKLWLDSIAGTLIGTLSAASVGISMFAGLAYFAEKIRARTSRISIPRGLPRGLKPLEILAMHNPNLVTE
jgi:hypothetical protein